jgi:hypothetical protein
VALFSGVFTRHRETKSMNWGDQRSLSRKVGGGFVGIIKIALEIDRYEYWIRIYGKVKEYVGIIRKRVNCNLKYFA